MKDKMNMGWTDGGGNNISDDERRAQAKMENGRMVGPWEVDRCKHGRVFSFRWYWATDAGPEDGDAEMGKSGCQKCEDE